MAARTLLPTNRYGPPAAQAAAMSAGAWLSESEPTSTLMCSASMASAWFLYCAGTLPPDADWSKTAIGKKLIEVGNPFE